MQMEIYNNNVAGHRHIKLWPIDSGNMKIVQCRCSGLQKKKNAPWLDQDVQHLIATWL